MCGNSRDAPLELSDALGEAGMMTSLTIGSERQRFRETWPIKLTISGFTGKRSVFVIREAGSKMAADLGGDTYRSNREKFVEVHRRHLISKEAP